MNEPQIIYTINIQITLKYKIGNELVVQRPKNYSIIYLFKETFEMQDGKFLNRAIQPTIMLHADRRSIRYMHALFVAFILKELLDSLIFYQRRQRGLSVVYGS